MAATRPPLRANPLAAGLPAGEASTDRIEWIELSLVFLPLSHPISDAKVLTGRQKPLTEIAFLFCELQTREGHAGVGFSYSKRAGGPGQYAHAKELAPALLGEDPNDTARLWDKLAWAGASVGRSGLAAQAIAAFDIALWDCKAKRARLPLAKLLGAHRDSVQCYNTSGGFLLCPADVCNLPDPSASFEFCPTGATPEGARPKFEVLAGFTHPLHAAMARFLQQNRIEVAGIEMIADAAGNSWVYDVNTNTNYNPDAEAAAVQTAQLAQQASVARANPALLALSIAVPVVMIGVLLGVDWLWFEGGMPFSLFVGLLAVFVGGSLVDHGGHNILEPAIFGKPIVFGPHMQNFQEIADAFVSNDAAVQQAIRVSLGW